METIKVIDLLNKIANEDAPKQIIYKSNIYDYGCYDYFNTNIGYLFDKYNVTGILNDTVIIIEDTPKEDKKIEKLDLQYKGTLKGIKFEEQMVMYCDNLQYKINEIIDRLNGENNE